MSRLWSHIAGALGLLTLAVLILNAGVFWILMEQLEIQFILLTKRQKEKVEELFLFIKM